MDVSAEAKRIMVQALGKLYSSRTQRGGLRLHRNLLLTLVMKSARDIYHSARTACENEAQSGSPLPDPQPQRTEEAMDTSDADGESCVSARTSEGKCKVTSANCKKSQEDKENSDPVRSDRHSRKRPSKAAAEPDFLPTKKARMETGEERHGARPGALRTTTGNCYRADETLTSLPMSRAITAF
ncbi:immediate early response gene 2 protein [Paramormyrops kingsleyae]|uniref:immediate early response gene 2 protein n=1 Tax=Paramormyrops kingsleyae TaxID=1676925 RepID=UPI000CD66828|nr:immediate early response gene 2 protein-like [Paramormyrops kingsleyae]